mmetsp:Transcript_101085/g.286496  ORF Transcript_101085/g.286496 Transcript_101085/m.286496 type:complete len:340 (+) Transcript_101085:949-1968(+)
MAATSSARSSAEPCRRLTPSSRAPTRFSRSPDAGLKSIRRRRWPTRSSRSCRAVLFAAPSCSSLWACSTQASSLDSRHGTSSSSFLSLASPDSSLSACPRRSSSALSTCSDSCACIFSTSDCIWCVRRWKLPRDSCIFSTCSSVVLSASEVARPARSRWECRVPSEAASPGCPSELKWEEFLVDLVEYLRDELREYDAAGMASDCTSGAVAGLGGLSALPSMAATKGAAAFPALDAWGALGASCPGPSALSAIAWSLWSSLVCFVSTCCSLSCACVTVMSMCSTAAFVAKELSISWRFSNISTVSSRLAADTSVSSSLRSSWIPLALMSLTYSASLHRN